MNTTRITNYGSDHQRGNLSPITSAIEKGPPRKPFSEKAVLASVLLRPERIGDVAPRLSVDDFYHPGCRMIYASMLRLHDAGKPVCPTLLIDDLDDHGQFDALGDGDGISLGELLALFDAVPIAAHCDHYVASVLEATRRRKAHNDGLRLLKAAHRSEQRGRVV